MSERPLAVGDPAPPFTAKTAAGELSLLSLSGRRVILYFYPRDNTPGCTKEACALRDDYEKFSAADIAIVGVSTDDGRSHQKFAARYTLPFPLIADTDAAVAKAYGVYGEKQFMGRTTVGIRRSTFVVDEQGTISHIFMKVKPETHSAELLAALGISTTAS